MDTQVPTPRVNRAGSSRNQATQGTFLSVLAREVPATQAGVWKGAPLDEQLLCRRGWCGERKNNQEVYQRVSRQIGTALLSLPIQGERLPEPDVNTWQR